MESVPLRQSALISVKARLVLDLVRGKKGRSINFRPQPNLLPVAKVTVSAAANAEHNYGMNVEDLVFAMKDQLLKDSVQEQKVKAASSNFNKEQVTSLSFYDNK